MKKIGILGTGVVGTTIGTKLIQLGYEVKMGSREAGNAKAVAWTESNGVDATQGSFSDAAVFGEVLFNCTKGEHALEAISLAGKQNLQNKILIDISNPLDFSHGMPPTLIPELVNTNSLGEAIQQAISDTYVVKTLNIVNCEVMVDALKCGGEATMFMAGNNDEAKQEVEQILKQFGWKDVIDLGVIAHARSMEMMLPIWLSNYLALKNPYVAFKIVRS